VKGMKRVSIETYGCTLNQADTDLIKGILEEAGYTLVPDSGIPKGSRRSRPLPAIRDVDVFILNTCAVKETTENKIISRIANGVLQDR